MKKLLIILLALVSLNIYADRWYIATTGSDSHGKGTSADPWLTLKHACDTVTGANFVGDTIMVGAGIFDETAQVVWDENIRLMGVAASPLTSIITSSNALNPIISGSSAVEGTDGNQSISYLKFDGNMTAKYAVLVFGRSNVDIHHCEFIDFTEWGVIFQGRTSGGSGAPATFSTGNKFRYNTMANCSTYSSGWGRGALAIGGQQTMLIHDNDIRQEGRTAGQNGYCMKFPSEGYNKDIKIYNNFFKRDYIGEVFNIVLEFWNSLGGIEIYDNEFWNGYVDIGGNPVGSNKGAYSYSFDVHNNTFRVAVMDYNEVNGVVIEGNASDVIVRQNYFENIGTCISFSIGQPTLRHDRISVFYNIFKNYGWMNVDYGTAIAIGSDQANAVFEDIYIYNNTFYDNGDGYDPRHCIWFLTHNGTFTNFNIKNNIFINSKVSWLRTQLQSGGSGTFTSLTLANNIAYGNANSNNPEFDAGLTPVTYSNTDLTKADPLFRSTSDFHLQATSPAINAGIDVSAITGGLDFHGASKYGAAYDIGAFEYGVGRLVTIGTTVPTINYKLVLIDH